MDKKNLAFSKINFILLAISVAIVVLGFILMSGGSSTETQYNPEIFSAMKIKVAPVVTFIGFISIIGAIMYQPKHKRRHRSIMDLIQTIIIAIVEGLTEFLPVSSTGHMIITQHLLGVQQGNPFVHAFTFIIQFGAILSVVCLYWKKFFSFKPEMWKLYGLLIIGVFPAVVVGLAAKKSGLLDWLLDSIWVVAITLVLGGIFMLFCDNIFNKGREENEVTPKRAFLIGLFQCLSVIPGMSRSMSTIVGGMANKLTRKKAAEFSFLPCRTDDGGRNHS